MELTLGEEKQITTFAQAVQHVSGLAQARLPESLHGNVQRATALVLGGHVWMDDDGKHAQVLSSDGTTWYLVNGNCTCMGVAHAPNALCKHRLAVAIYRRASELLATSSSGRVQPAAAEKTTLPEAPASVNVRVLIDGHEAQVTLRDTDEERLLTRLAALLARYPQACGGKRTPDAPAHTPPPSTAGETPTCPYHGAMRESTKVKGTFYCPSRMGDGTFCKEKSPKK